VKNTDRKDNQLNLPKYVSGPPVNRGNWDYYPADEEGKVQEMYEQIERLKDEGQLRAEDLICTFLKHRVSPLQCRAHKICHMSGPLDPNRHSTFELTNAEVWERLKAISRTQLTPEWSFGKEAFSRRNMPPVSMKPCRIFLDHVKLYFSFLLVTCF
jgi:hypothetical protein